jgi:serine protease Do
MKWRQWVRIWMSAGVMIVPWLLQGNPESGVSSLQSRIVEIYRTHSSGVIRIKATTAANEEEAGSASLRVGTGFIVSRDGHVLANASVIEGAKNIWAEHQDIPYLLEQVGHDPSTNLALLKFVNPPAKLQVLPLDSEENGMAIGSFLLAITMPLEFEATPVWGMLSGRESYFGNRFFPVSYYRATIPVGPGASGAPVFNMQGQMVGMIVASLPDLQSAYILPTRALARIRDGLLFSGEVQHAFLGIEINEQTGAGFGRRVIVTEVLAGGPADKAGIRVDDILLEFTGRPIQRFNDFVDAVFYIRPGQEVDLVVMRGEERVPLSMRVEKREPATP